MAKPARTGRFLLRVVWSQNRYCSFALPLFLAVLIAHLGFVVSQQKRKIAMAHKVWITICLILALTAVAPHSVLASEGIELSVNLISAGLNHTCMVTNSMTQGGVVCWGDNFAGQLGSDSLSSNIYVPVAVVTGPGSTTPLGGVKSVAAGWQHTCALMVTGQVKCWGYNSNGQLGDGTTATSRAPVAVMGLASSVIAISAGWNYTCALLDTGALQCWGANGFGKLGTGDTTDRHTPADVIGLAGTVKAVAAGQGFTCAVLTTGTVQCWGANNFGQLGNNSYTASTTPVTVKDTSSADLVGASAIAAGFNHACAVAGGGAVCWGRNEYGQLGNNSTFNSPFAVSVSNLASSVVAVSAGSSHSCGRTTGGGIFCWGADFYGQLGDGTSTTSYIPVQAMGLTSANVALAVGQHHSCIVNAASGAKCWGYNYNGQLGNNSTTTSNVPTCVTSFCFEPVVPPEEGIQNIIDGLIPPLVSSGTLDSGQANSLVVKLNAALDKLAQGNVKPAINRLQSFIKQVQGWIEDGTLLPGEGQPLIDAANKIIDQLSP